MAWRLAKSLTKLRDQANELAPRRSKSADGTIGDAAHAKRTSDHNPWVRDGKQGVVTAIDLTHDPKGGFDAHAVAEHLRGQKDARIKYIISNRRIASTTGNWAWRKYGGSNPHVSHMHVSVSANKTHYDSMKPWPMPGKKEAPATIEPTPEVQTEDDPDMPIKRPLLAIGSRGEEVRLVQRLLGLQPDGQFGPLVDAAVRGFQRAVAVNVDGKVGPDTWAALDELEQFPVDRWFHNIVATVFGGRADPNKSAYEKRWISDEELGVALPHRFKDDRPQVEVENPITGKRVICQVVDVGPWNTDDPYWEKNARPQAESGVDRRGRRTNSAGIDLTPGAARAIGLKGKGKVSWAFAETEDESA